MAHPRHTHATDAQLVAAYVAGDADAFGEIVARHGTRMLWIARRYTSNDHDAHDVLQDALLRASQNLHRFRCEARLTTWLHRLVANSGYDFTQRRCRCEMLTLDDATILPLEANAALSYEPIRQVDLALMLRTALTLVRPDQAMALVLIDAIGYSIDDVAARQHVAPGTIKSRRARARTTLRAALADAA